MSEIKRTGIRLLDSPTKASAAKRDIAPALKKKQDE
jgi:hypothetical protein